MTLCKEWPQTLAILTYKNISTANENIQTLIYTLKTSVIQL